MKNKNIIANSIESLEATAGSISVSIGLAMMTGAALINMANIQDRMRKIEALAPAQASFFGTIALGGGQLPTPERRERDDVHQHNAGYRINQRSHATGGKK